MFLTFRQAAVLAAVSLMMPGTVSAAHAETREFNIPGQSAARGVRDFARQADIQVLVAGLAVRGRVTQAVRGRMEVRTALKLLLANSGLDILTFDGNVAVLEVALAAHGEVNEQEPIIVTGSRIKRPQSQSAMPVQVIDVVQAQRSGRTSLYDILAREPAVAPGIGLGNAFRENWDAGVSSVSLRNLGANRSLTLVDGMRRVSGSARSSAVDITMIPISMVERVEVITGGATAIYGADAVTGALNIVTKSRIDGTHLSLTNGLSQKGDAGEFSASVTTGAQFAQGRGRLALGGTFSRIRPLDYAQRYASYLRSTANPANTGANDGIFDQISVPDFRQIYYSYTPSFYSNGQSYLVENGTLRPAVYDETYYSGQFSYGNGGDGRNLRDADQLRGGLDALSILGRVEFDLTDDLKMEFYADFGASHYIGTASLPLPRDDSRSIWFNGAGGSVAYFDNPYLPVDVRQFMLDNGLFELSIERTYGNFPVLQERHTRRSITVGQEFEGHIGGALDWSVFWQAGRTSDHVSTSNIPYMSHWLAARDAVADPVTGQPMCRNEVARAAGCVPLDIFSTQPPSEQLKAYVLGTRKEERLNTQIIWGGNLTGEPFRLPAGPVSMVLGVERRQETLRTTDDPLAESEFTYGGSGFTVHPDLAKSFHVSEAYSELKIPLLSGRPLAWRLELEGAYRYSHYDSIGAAGTWKAGGIWAPVHGLMFRAMRSRSVRTPNFGELYEPAISKQAGSITDPCEAADYYQSETRSANCRALGITVPLGDFKVGPVITTEGNPRLLPETSNSLTLGAVIRPAGLPGLETTLDYWDIDISDAITQFEYTDILNLCVDLPSIDNVFCREIVRDSSDGRVTQIYTRQINAARMRARGIDLGLRYVAHVGGGQFAFELNGTYLLQRDIFTAAGLSSGNVKSAGDWQNPRFQTTLQATYDLGKWYVGTNLHFISSGRYDVNAESDEVYDRNTIPAYVYVDASAGVRLKGGKNIELYIRNITNVFPPMIYPVYMKAQEYDQIGRFVAISFKFDF